MDKGTLIVIGGATASGKTDAAVQLAHHFGTEVISADSRQFYGAMRIGTARPQEAELLGVPHHFLGHLEITETWSAGRFAREAETVLQRIIAEKGIAVLVGGSGLYLDALTKGLDPLPLSDPRLRETLRRRAEEHGLDPLLKKLHALDPATHERIDRNNPHRILRALEICLLTGKPYSAQRTGPSDRTDLRIIHVAMEVPREQLYQLIDTRVDRMIAEGLVEEARSLLPHRELNALRTVGYRELFDHFDGTFDLDEAIALIKQHTRNYAKRQMTWLRRDAFWTWIASADHARQIAHVESAR
ncbi:MAG: tRNA (adenosine(37)-N6)-dimethylallyltransferase MiaA [Flavobacteriales bacterium]|nr:tRNA (adenosine(37)-N6)-dimethylallyltransferase MiaA [Flavobacteriales bacterium]MCC6936883.1 tRNA (adenosine(37)-N6)-dimethylallyltransferase MiaA [Flavobacteriales bacterium]